MKKSILILFILLVILSTKSYSCTIIMVSDSNVTLAGSNEDSTFPLSMLWFIPASDGNYGRVCLGYKMMFNSIQGGMKILIVDDLLATGGTAAAVVRLVEVLGGEIVGIAFLIELNFLGGRDKLLDYPIHVLIGYDEE